MMGENSRIHTPSTTTSEIPADENQWIKRPPIPALYDPNQASDPTQLAKSLSVKEISIIHDYIELWSKNMSELLNKLRDTIPGEGMIGEVHYWRDMARILEGINEEVK